MSLQAFALRRRLPLSVGPVDEITEPIRNGRARLRGLRLREAVSRDERTAQATALQQRLHIMTSQLSNGSYNGFDWLMGRCFEVSLRLHALQSLDADRA